MNYDPKTPELTSNRVDGLTSLAKGVVGAAPFIGPTLSEILGHIIPNQRMDRITEFVQLLDKRLAAIEAADIEMRMKEPENVNLLEDGFIQAARSTTRDRLEHLANLIANGLSKENADRAEAKRMIWLLSQLSDQEVVVLRGALPTTRGEYELDKEFQEKHGELLVPEGIHLGSSNDEADIAELKTSYKRHLSELGLLRPRFTSVKKGEIPEFDQKTGMIKSSGFDVSRLGKMLLKYVDLLPKRYRN